MILPIGKKRSGSLIIPISIYAGFILVIAGLSGILLYGRTVIRHDYYGTFVAPSTAVISWIAGVIILFVGYAVQAFTDRKTSRFSLHSLWLPAIPILAGIFFRYYGLDHLPWGKIICGTVPRFVVEDAWKLGADGTLPVWHTEIGIFFIYYLHAAFALLGPRSDLFALSMPALGITGTVAAFLWAKEILRTQTALFFFTLIYSLSAIDAVLQASPIDYGITNIWLIVVLLLLSAALKRNPKNGTPLFAVSGIVYGLGPFTSLSAFPLAPIPFFLILWEFLFGGRKKTVVKGVLVFSLFALPVAAPVLVTTIRSPEMIIDRVWRNKRDMVLNRDRDSSGEPLKSIHILGRTMALYVTGSPVFKDSDEMDNFGSNTPMRTWLIPLVIAGVLIIFIGRLRDGPLVTAFLFALSPIYICFFNRIINIRLASGIPGLSLLAVIPLDALLSHSDSRIRLSGWKPMFVTVISVLILFGVTTDIVKYFRGLGIERGVSKPIVLLADEIRKMPQDTPLFFAFDPGPSARNNPGLANRRCIKILRCLESLPDPKEVSPDARRKASGQPVDTLWPFLPVENCPGWFYYSPDALVQCLDPELRSRNESRFLLVFPDAPQECSRRIINGLGFYAAPVSERRIDVSGRIPEVNDRFLLVEMARKF